MDRIQRLADDRLRILAPAKLNLGLRVAPVRPDGFHPLETWMVPTGWYDTLTITFSDQPLQLRITGRAEGIPTEIDKNLIGRAAVKLAQAAGWQNGPRGIIELHKVLPPGGGLGGGSSDAANTLLALNEGWGLLWPEEKLVEIAASLGSDIPFFVPGRAALCTGRGEIMTPLPGKHSLFAVLILPPQGCPTKEVYQAFDAGHQHPEPIRARWTEWHRLAELPAEALLPELVNDLEPPAFHVAPWLAELQKQAAAIAQQPVHMTGSGSTLFTLAGTAARAEEMRQRLEAALPPSHAIVATPLAA